MTSLIRDTLEAAQRDADLLYWETGDEYTVNKTYQGTFYAIQVHPATGINSLKNISEQHFEQNNVANVTNVTTVAGSPPMKISIKTFYGHKTNKTTLPMLPTLPPMNSPLTTWGKKFTGLMKLLPTRSMR